MKINKQAFVSAAALLAFAQSAAAANIDTNMARMQAMDKITGRVSEIDVPVNGAADFGSFSIVVRRCVTRSPEETPENTAFVDVVDTYNHQEPVNIFKGWMMSSSPALNAVEHPIYDVWLIKCYDGSLKGKTLLTEAELNARDEVTMLRPAESPKPAQEIAAEVAAVPEANTETEEVMADNETADVEVQDVAADEVVSVVVTTPDEAEDGAPRALLQVQTTVAEPAEISAPAEEPPALQAEIPTEDIDEEDGFIAEDEEIEILESSAAQEQSAPEVLGENDQDGHNL